MRYISFRGCLPSQYPCGFPWCVTVCVTGTVTVCVTGTVTLCVTESVTSCVTGNVTLSVAFSLPVSLKSFPDLKIIA